MDVGRHAIGEQKALRVLAAPLTNLISWSIRDAFQARVMKLVPTGRDAARTEDGRKLCRDLAIAEVHELAGHFDLRWKNPCHLRAIDGFRQIHQASAFRVESLPGFDELPDGFTHRDVRFKLIAIQLRVSAANV